MKSAKLDDMIRGWFVGNFEPTLYRTNDVEVAVKKYTAGEFEEAHYHKIATEITVVQSGKIKMADKVWEVGDIIVLEPGDVSSFEALTEATLVVVKLPGANNDKYLA
ncbi:MAG: cupin domain-containing protein [Selenomonadaceae bacterium]|nr:cupin domain-containing protein [Selenomonadaceae bacterium]